MSAKKVRLNNKIITMCVIYKGTFLHYAFPLPYGLCMKLIAANLPTFLIE